MRTTSAQTRILVLTEKQYDDLLTAVGLARDSYLGIPEWKKEEATYERLLRTLEEQ